jgi:hypothetical protein
VHADVAHANEPVTQDELVRSARRAFELGEALDWKSYDPFDILLSPYLWPVRRAPLAARALVQLGRRSGTRVRRILRVQPHEEPKALADFVQAAVLLAASGEQWATGYLEGLTQRLVALSIPVTAGRGWGIRFPYVSRFGTIEPGTPILYTTTTVCQALFDDHALTRRASAYDAAIAGCSFILDGLGHFTHHGHTWLPYTPGARHPIVNVQASVASVLARFAENSDSEQAQSAADRAVEAVLATQRADGSWPYSDDGRGPFVDGYHTGFVLQGLREYRSRRGDGAVPGVADAIVTGLAYFKQHLIAPDGLPRGLADGRVSLDGQNVAQCIQTLVECGDAADAWSALRLWKRCIATLPAVQDASARSLGYSLRWSIGPAVLATAYLVRALSIGVPYERPR